jgi:hypothetical protein
MAGSEDLKCAAKWLAGTSGAGHRDFPPAENPKQALISDLPLFLSKKPRHPTLPK